MIASEPPALKRLVASIFAGLLLSGAVLAGATPQSEANAPVSPSAGWPNWRGPTHDGISREKGWLTAWPKEGPRPLWKAELGPGHAGVAAQAGHVFVMGREGRQDVVFCLDAGTGATVWKHAYPAAPSAYGSGPRATPAVDGNAVYTMSPDGQAFCLNAATGQVVWGRNLQKELNLPMPTQNFATAPILEGRLLLLNMGASGLALDKGTGAVVWKSSGDSSYSSPVPFTLAGKRCVALFAASGLAVVDLANGQRIASHKWLTMGDANCADPVIVGDAVFISSGYNRGCALIDLAGGNATVRWKKDFQCLYASPVLADGYLYMLAETGWLKADLVCISTRDGSLRWRQKDVGSGGLIVADGKLLILSRGGELILAEASPAAYTEIARAKIFTTGDCWNGPVLCDGRIYVRNEKGTLICLDVRPTGH